MDRRLPSWLVGALFALPVAGAEAWLVQATFDQPSPTWIPAGKVLAAALMFGSARALAFGAGFLLAGAWTGRKLARNEASRVGGFFRLVLIGLVLGTTFAVIDSVGLARMDAAAVAGIPIRAVFSGMGTFVAWGPGAVVWALLAWRYLSPDEIADRREAAAAYEATNEAARAHHVADALIPQDQRSGWRIGRG